MGGVTGLYSINLTTGAATLVGTVGGGTAVRGLAALPDNDTLVWSNGDGSDVMDGGAGNDTVQVNGAVGAVGDAFLVQPGAGGRLDFRRTNLGLFALDIGTTEVDGAGVAPSPASGTTRRCGTAGPAATSPASSG